MTFMSEKSSGRDNNLNLIRAIAAIAVLVSHASFIALGKGTPEPLQLALGYTLGTLAVFVFFVVSGFLITMSYERTASKRQFIFARAVRLIPGIFISVVLVALVMGPIVTTLPVWTYLTHPETWSFIAKNTALVKPQNLLPGVFETQPYPLVEASIWTLVYEVLCYIGVFIVGILGLLRKPALLSVLLVLYVLGWCVKNAMDIHIVHYVDNLYKLSVPFVLGMLAYLWQHKIPLSLGIVIGFAALTWLLRNTAAYDIALIMTVSYATLWAAFMPDGAVRAYNNIGDYSYGIYIYAVPMQGLVIWLFGPMTPLSNIFLALPPTLLCAVLSWHYVEKPALGWRKSRTAQRFFDYKIA